MIKRSAFVFLALVFALSFVYAAIPDDCDSNMVSYWEFDGDATDSVGSNDGVTFGGPQVDSGIKLSSSDLLELPTLSVDSFTFGGQFKVSTFFIDGDFIFTKGLKLNLSQVDNYLVLNLGSLALNSTILSSDYNSFPDLLFSLFLTYDGSQAILYLDGSEVDRGGVSFNWIQGNLSFEGNTEFELFIDELAFFNESLSSSEISELYSLSSQSRNYCYVPPTLDTGDSSTRSSFNLFGCVLPSGGILPYGSCSFDGLYYCDVSGTLLETIEDEDACSAYSSGDCCPVEYACRTESDSDLSKGSGNFCYQRKTLCSDYDDKDDCINDDEGCYWVGDECVAPNDGALSCSLYKTENGCQQDIYDLAHKGADAREKCGSITSEDRIIPYDSCLCSWADEDGDGDEECYFDYSIYDYFSEDGSALFKCSKLFNNTDCVNGKQTISWTAKNTGTSVGEETLKDAGCVNGSMERNCGEALVKLPFFGLFNVVSVALVLGLVYFGSRKP